MNIYVLLKNQKINKTIVDLHSQKIKMLNAILFKNYIQHNNNECYNLNYDVTFSSVFTEGSRL